MIAAIARFCALLLLVTGVQAQTLALPENLIDFRSERGGDLLLESEAHEAYFPLASNFVTQQNQAYCGVASIVMVLNALGLPAPSVPEFDPYKTFTQANVLSEQTDAVLPRDTLAKIGMTLDQIGGILESYPIDAEVRHAAHSSVDQFRTEASEYLGSPDRFVIVNYLRKAINQERGGHISPLAAYDKDTDRFLILDVARYKYPPVWVATSDLFAAMNTTDSDNNNQTRGYLMISKR